MSLNRRDLHQTLLLPFACVILVAILVLVCCFLVLYGESEIFSLAKSAGFFLLGLCGAIFANSTGAGGGVVFIPAFDQLGLTDVQAVATSFGIQCFGMTAGAITWYRYHQKKHRNDSQWQSFSQITFIGSAFSVIGLWSNFSWSIDAPAELHQTFRIFSLFLGVSILITVYLLKSDRARHQLSTFDLLLLAALGLGGGLVTGWLSVGVGEFIAFYLILRRFNITMAVASAVIISAFTVWAAAPKQLWIDSNVQWQVILAAGPGAIIGGILARRLATKLPVKRFKIFFAIWLILIGLAA